jgi:hypothetical protein
VVRVVLLVVLLVGPPLHFGVVLLRVDPLLVLLRVDPLLVLLRVDPLLVL